jgi:Mn-containing catalase
VNLFNSQGNAWTADYLKITGELDVDLRSNIAAEARAKIVYERLINFCTDVGSRDALQFLMTREITHMKAFTAALESMGKGRFTIGMIPPTEGVVDQFFNDSTGEGDQGEFDARGPWNEGGEWHYVENPAFEDLRGVVNGHSTNGSAEPPMLQDLLVEELQDLLHAETQVLKALPKMEKAAHSNDLKMAFQRHLQETQQQVERLRQSFEILGMKPKPKECKGMAGLLEEGEEMMKEGKAMEDTASDLALIAAAQKVEHYEISGYGTARTMAMQIGRPEIANLLSKTLAEEEKADNLLTQVARPLMSGARSAAPAAEEAEPAATSSRGRRR